MRRWHCGAGSLGLLLTLLAACRSAPIEYYSLLAAPAAARPLPAAERPLLLVDPVSVPAALDRPELVVHAPDGRWQILEQHQWIEPLGEDVRAALIDQLARALPGWQVARSAPLPVPASSAHLIVSLERLDFGPGPHVRLSGSWRVLRAPAAPLSAPMDLETLADGTGWQALVRAQSTNIAALAEQVGAALAH